MIPKNPSEHVNLSNCDREPIHIPGSIQTHGCLLACDMAARTILRHSNNAGTLLGVDGELNGQHLELVLGTETVHTLRNALTRSGSGRRPALMFGVTIGNGRVFDISIHTWKSTTIIEFEPAHDGIAEPLELTRTMISRVSSITGLNRLLGVTARLVHGLFQYDRVMIYQLAQDGSGKVVSEAKVDRLESFLGQHFPASDIPLQARQLYLRNTIRIISDSDGHCVPVVPALDSSGEPLDLSFAHLRSVSQVHCEYLRNMGVGASMSISIIVDGALWGLIACHHYSPRTLSMAERAAAEMFGDFFSLHLNSLRQAQKLEVATHARRSLDQFLRVSANSADPDEAIFGNLREFSTLLPCDGAAVLLKGKWKSAGSVPSAKSMTALARFAETVAEGQVWATHMVSNHLPGSESFSDVAAGVLIIPLSQRPRDYLFFFRKELVQTLNWAGNPDKSYEVGPLGDRLTPRKSFAIWKEIVHGQSSPWTEEDREIAEAARTALVEVALHHNELLEEERVKSDVRQRMLNDELNHRVKNILAVIKSLVSAPSEAIQTLEQYVDSLRGRIQALAFAHDQIVRGHGGGALRDLVDAELTPYRDQNLNINIDGPAVWLDARAFSVMALMLHEMVTNAVKYGSLSRSGGSLSLRWTCADLEGCTIEWQESGGPIVNTPSRRGFGTVLIDRSISYDLGGESHVSYNPDGLHAKFRIPARFVAVGSKQAASVVRKREALPLIEIDLSDRRVLIVEDEMLIAMNLEQILHEAGVIAVDSVSSTSAAIEKLRAAPPDIAILDVNLGRDTSLAVANELLARNIPFVLTTGYGESSAMSQRFPEVPIISKPYEASSIIAELSALLRK